MLLIYELRSAVKRLMRVYWAAIGSRKKFRFVLKRLYSELTKFICKHEFNRYKYSTQIFNTLVSWLNWISNALKKLAEAALSLQTKQWSKPYFQVRFDISRCSVLGDLRKVGDVFLKRKSESTLISCFLVSIKCRRAFSIKIEIDDVLNQQIMDKLKSGIWPTDDNNIKQNIINFMETSRRILLSFEAEQQLVQVESFIFDIKNRIYSIDKVFKIGKSFSYGQVGYSDLTTEAHKFSLLESTKLSRLSKLPPCKTIMVTLPKIDGGTRLLRINMPIDKVLQTMFLNFLDIIVEDLLTPNVFAYRKGKDGRMAVASIYSKLNKFRVLKGTGICSISLTKCFDNLQHLSIFSSFPFPRRYNYLLVRWLESDYIDKKNNFKNLGKNLQGVSQSSVLGPLIMNYMLSRALPPDVLKQVTNIGKFQKCCWVNTFSYIDDILVISNSRNMFYQTIVKLEFNLNRIGLTLRYNKIKYITNFTSKIKFNFMGFEFIIIFWKVFNYTSLRLSRKLFNFFTKGLKIILRPQISKFSEIKKKIKKTILLIHSTPQNKLYKVFNYINSLVLGWAAYFFFNQGYLYVKRLDNLVFKWLKKSLVKKFRYNGLKRPKWVAYNYLGFGHSNPNGKIWQFRVSRYFTQSNKILGFTYIWAASDIFYPSCISTLSLGLNLRAGSYYRLPLRFRLILTNFIFTKLVSNFKFTFLKSNKDYIRVVKNLLMKKNY